MIGGEYYHHHHHHHQCVRVVIKISRMDLRSRRGASFPLPLSIRARHTYKVSLRLTRDATRARDMNATFSSGKTAAQQLCKSSCVGAKVLVLISDATLVTRITLTVASGQRARLHTRTDTHNEHELADLEACRAVVFVAVNSHVLLACV